MDEEEAVTKTNVEEEELREGLTLLMEEGTEGFREEAEAPPEGEGAGQEIGETLLEATEVTQAEVEADHGPMANQEEVENRLMAHPEEAEDHRMVRQDGGQQHQRKTGLTSYTTLPTCSKITNN